VSQEFKIRCINLDDAQATLDIYAPFVQQTAVSFEYEVPSLKEWESRIAAYTKDCPWLVCAHLGEVVGYAYAGKHRTRIAYAWSAEVTIYLLEPFHGRGIARELYKALFALLKEQGYVNVLAGVTIPNVKSETFHLKMGFEEVGVYRKVGYKFGAWHDTFWFQRHLVEHPRNPQMPTPFEEIHHSAAVHSILSAASAALRGK
jgi:L-amino acid N-acyltransferase YncA